MSCVNRKQCAGIIFSTVTPDNVYLHYLHMEHTHVCNFTICLMISNSLYHQLDNTIVRPYFKQSNENPALASWS